MIHLAGYLGDFFAGAFLCNCIPHLVSGLQGAPFPSPFAKPPGFGDSSPLVNFLWGTFNLLVGIALVSWHPAAIHALPDFATLAVGFMVLGIQLSLHFGKVRRDRSAK